MRSTFILLFVFLAATVDGATSLVLETDKDVYRVGEMGVITLRIEGAEIDPAPSEQAGFVSPTEVILFSSIPADTGFAYRIRWRAKTVGEQTIGPFTLTVDGKVIRSNEKVVRVVPEEIQGIEASFDRIEVEVGSDFSVEVRTKGRKLDGIRLKRSDLVSAGSVTTSTSSSFSGGKMSMSNSYKIPLKALKPGTFEISPGSFEGIDPDVTFTPIRITIKKKEKAG